MKKIIIEPGCISCGTCAFVAPNVFEVTDRSRVKENTDLEENQKNIEEAIKRCPMQIIKHAQEEQDI